MFSVSSSSSSTSPPGAALGTATLACSAPSTALGSTGPADTKTTTPAATSDASTATSASPASPLSAPAASARMDFTYQLRRAVEQGVVSPSLATEIKTRFSASFSAYTPPAATTSTTSAPTPGGTAALPGTSSSSYGVYAPPLNAGMQSLLSSVTQTDSASQTRRSDADVHYTRHALELLNLLSLCESGSYHSDEVAPGMAGSTDTPSAPRSGGDVASFGSARQSEEDVTSRTIRGLHAAVAAMAHSTATHIIAYLGRELANNSSNSSSEAVGAGRLTEMLLAHTVSASALSSRHHDRTRITGSTSAPSDAEEEEEEVDAEESDAGTAMSAAGQMHAAYCNPVLLAAQCLYLLTRHFQMQASHVRELLRLLEQWCTRVLTEETNGGLGAAAAETRPLAAVLWLVLFSTLNAVAVWKRVRGGEDGSLRLNVLIQSDVASSLDGTVRTLREAISSAARSAASASPLTPSHDPSAAAAMEGREGGG